MRKRLLDNNHVWPSSFLLFEMLLVASIACLVLALAGH